MKPFSKREYAKPGRKIRLFSWAGYFITVAAMMVLAALPGILYSEQKLLTLLLNEYLGWYVLYCAVAAAVLTVFTAYQKHRAFSEPLQKMCTAAEQVAKGDFSVYLEPLHTEDKQNYIDLMFQNFNKMVAELGSIETLKNDFVANVSHEIKTPLAVIRNYTTILQKEELSEETRQTYMKSIIMATDRLTSLVTNILKLNKLDNQEIAVLPEPYDLCAQISECILRYESIWEQKKIQLEVTIEDRATIRADAEMMELVWNNLISNALKFTAPGGSVSVAQTSSKEWITISVSDSGCGMTEETARHIFDKFYQGDTSHAQEGNGLGLALVQRVVDRHGGTVSVKSKPGAGSTFTVNLPVL